MACPSVPVAHAVAHRTHVCTLFADRGKNTGGVSALVFCILRFLTGVYFSLSLCLKTENRSTDSTRLVSSQTFTQLCCGCVLLCGFNVFQCVFFSSFSELLISCISNSIRGYSLKCDNKWRYSTVFTGRTKYIVHSLYLQIASSRN